jgi:hypothetical protein
LCDKFGDDKLMEKVEEVIKVTKIGQNIYNDGYSSGEIKGEKKGIIIGREQGLNEGLSKAKQDILRKILVRKIGKIPDSYKEKIQFLDNEEIEMIIIDIIDMTNKEDIKKCLEKYFN